MNLWVKDLPFKLDRLPDLPRYVLPGHFQTSFDDKSGYQHVLLHPSSRTSFGLEWNGVYFVFCTLRFGWKASAYIYHNLGLAVMGAAHSFGVPESQYIDDRHVGQLYRAPTSSTLPLNKVLAEAAAYILCYLLIEAGYFIATAKSQCVPSVVIRFLGFFAILFAKLFFFPLTKSPSSGYSGRTFYPPGMLVLRPFRGLREKLSRSVWPSLVANSASVKLSRPFPSSAAPLSCSFALRETLVQRFYTGVSSMIGEIVSLGAPSFT